MLVDYELEKEKEESDRARQEAMVETVIHENKTAEENKQLELARQEALADTVIYDNETAEENKESEVARQEALADAGFDAHDAQVDAGVEVQVKSENHDLLI